MKVAFVLSALGAGGAERVIAQITAGAVQRGWDVTVIAFDAAGDSVYHSFDPRVRLQRLGSPAGSAGPRAAMAAVRRVPLLRAALVAGEFDVVVSFLIKINVLTLLAAAGLGLPVIVSERNNPRRQPVHRVWKMLVHLLYARARAVVILSERVRSLLPATARERAFVIPNPFRPSQVTPRQRGPKMIAAVGRLDRQKGFDILLDAYAMLVLDHPDWRLVIWGEGPERSTLEAQVRRLGLDHQVDLPGASSPGAWIECATVFVLSSRYEGFANVVGEAMSAGLPVVAFDCDFGPAEMIRHQRNGLLAEPENAAALAHGLRMLLHSEELRRRLGEQARQDICALDAETIVGCWLSLIDSVSKPAARGEWSRAVGLPAGSTKLAQ